MRFFATIALAAVTLMPITTLAAHSAAPWTPQPAIYAVGMNKDLPVIAKDGTVLRADVYFPTQKAAGVVAKGPFPVLLQQTPYGKGNIGGAAALADTDIAYLVERGFIVVISDVRGTGDSGGTFGLLDPIQQSDGATLVNWAAHLAHSDGKVGLFGESYMGINQFLTVAGLPNNSPVKAIFPEVAANDIYKDIVTQGGIADIEFPTAYLGLVSALDALNPLENPSAATLGLELSHAASITSYDVPITLAIAAGGDAAYDQSYWAQRNPANVLAKVVADHIPAFLVGGWNDLFQRGELLNYVGLQNLWAGRAQSAAMTATQPITPRYQLLMGPWEHTTTGLGLNMARIQVEWFDTWLLGENTPLAHTADPLHFAELNSQGSSNTDSWLDASRWPMPAATPTKYYFGAGPSASHPLSLNDGMLTTTPPTVTTAGDLVASLPVSSPCNLQSGQWGAGLIRVLAGSDPCEQNDSTFALGGLTYTTAPFSQDQVLGGPIDASLFATSTTPETQLVATIEAVSPSGQSLPFTSGSLAGSFRALDQGTWLGTNHAVLKPDHPYTAASRRPVTPGQVTRYDIEVFPTFALIPKGWRLRVTITTADTPHELLALPNGPQLLAGVYTVERNANGPSFVNVPLGAASAWSTPCGSLCT
jgi:hypothetical protein